MSSLFDAPSSRAQPLADRLRPQELSELIGQECLFEGAASVEHFSSQTPLPSLILWGPPGCGKTSLAKILAQKSNNPFVSTSAVLAGTPQFREIFDQAAHQETQTVLLVDEIHRLNRAQQDTFLPHVESGAIALIGTTTENPSFELTPALLSRCKVLTLSPLGLPAMEALLCRAESCMGKSLPLTPEARATLCHIADGDGRYLLNRAEDLFSACLKDELSSEQLLKMVRKRAALYDKKGEGHYNLISALHKSLRGSDVQAALYWMARMLEGGEDPLYLLRRLIRFASEDVGLADPQALAQAVSALQAYQFLGSPEGDLVLSPLVIYLAMAPKSVSAYKAFEAAKSWARESSSLMPPKSILNAPNSWMKAQGYGKGYIYPPDAPEEAAGQNFLPDELTPRRPYVPVERGFEREIKKRFLYWERLAQARKAPAKKS